MSRRLLKEGTLSGNTAANLAGKLAPGVLTLVVVPFLLPLIGAEGYGVIGLYASFLIVFATLEVALGITATRQVARNGALERGGDANRSLLRTLEVVYWGAGVAIAATLVAGSSWIAGAFINSDQLGQPEVRNAIAAGGVAIAARWPISLYKGLLDGLQLQVTQNRVTVVGAVLRTGAAVPFVAWVYPSIVGFMLWQVVAASVELAAMGFFAWRVLGGHPIRARFHGRTLRVLWGFAATLTVVSVLGAVLTQADRFVISYLLPIADLGYFTLAMTAVGPVPLVAAAVAAAALPRFSSQLAREHTEALELTYRQAFDAIAFMAVWITLPLAFFSHKILVLWTGSEAVAAAADTVLTLLAIAYLFNALYALPYTLILAAGRTRVPLIVNAVSVPIVVAVTYWLVPSLGLVGAAAIWLAVMAIHFAVYGLWVHRTLLPDRFLASLVRPARFAVAGLAVFAVARWVTNYTGTGALSYLVALAAMALNGLLGVRLLPTDLRSILPGPPRRQPGRADKAIDEPMPLVPEGAVEPEPPL